MIPKQHLQGLELQEEGLTVLRRVPWAVPVVLQLLILITWIIDFIAVVIVIIILIIILHCYV